MFGRKTVAIEAIKQFGQIAAVTDCPRCREVCIEQICEIEESWHWGAQVGEMLDRSRKRRRELWDRLFNRQVQSQVGSSGN